MVEWRRWTALCESFSPGREAARSPMCLHQGRRSVLDYLIEFHTLATESGWNNPALVDAFVSGLSQQIKDQLVSLDLPDELDSLVAITNKIDRPATFSSPVPLGSSAQQRRKRFW